MARQSKILGALLSTTGRWQDIYASLTRKEQARVYREIVRETTRALKTVPEYTRQQYASRGTRRGRYEAHVYKTEARAQQEIDRALTVLRTRESIKVLAAQTAQERAWAALQADSYLSEYLRDLQDELGITLTQRDVAKITEAYTRAKWDLPIHTQEEYQRLAREIVTVYLADRRQGWQRLRAQAVSRGGSYYMGDWDIEAAV